MGKVERRAVESCFTRNYNLPEHCGTLSASCSVVEYWLGWGISVSVPIEIFFHSRHLNHHRQGTCSWALHWMCRVMSLLLQEGWNLEKAVHLLTKECCPVWSEMLGHMTCPSRIEQMLKEAHTVRVPFPKQPLPRQLKQS